MKKGFVGESCGDGYAGCSDTKGFGDCWVDTISDGGKVDILRTGGDIRDGRS